MIAPRMGPHMRSQVMGGPAWRRRFFFIPGMTSSAFSRPMSMGLAASILAAALALAAAMTSALARTVLQRAGIHRDRRPPVHLDGRRVAMVQTLLEGFQADVDDLELALEEVFDGHRFRL